MMSTPKISQVHKPLIQGMIIAMILVLSIAFMFKKTNFLDLFANKTTGINGLTIRNSKGSMIPRDSFDLTFSTYLGGSEYEHARDIYVDGQGYVYVTGFTRSTNFPITVGPTFNNGPCSSLGLEGRREAFVTKFTPDGDVVWSRFVGGPCYDGAYGIEVDSQGYVYIAGQAGEGFPVTPGAFQTQFQGSDFGIYGWQNAFVAKLSPDGINIVWASYVGVGLLARDLAIDSNGNVYLPLGYSGQGNAPPAAWFANAFQPTPNGGLECGAIKVSADGSRVLWATWVGGSNDDSQEGSIRVDSLENVYLTFYTYSSDAPTTPGAFDPTFNGGADRFLVRISANGSNLVYGTYLGGSGDEFLDTHNLALDNQGNAYVSTGTSSTNYPVTPGVFQGIYGGGSFDMAISKFSPTGALIASTYIGGAGSEGPDGIYTDSAENVFFTGGTDSADFPVTPDAYQQNKSGGSDAVLVKLSDDFSHLMYSTYLGGGSNDEGRTGYMGLDGSIYVAGQTNGNGWPVFNPFQQYYGGGPLDAIVAKFATTTISPTPTLTITPPPGATPTSTSTVVPPTPTVGPPSPTCTPTRTSNSTPTATAIKTLTPVITVGKNTTTPELLIYKVYLPLVCIIS